MIEFRNLYPTQEEFIFGLERSVAMANEALRDVELLVNRFMAGEYFVTEEDISGWFKCPVEELPDIPHKIRFGKHCIWKKSDVDAFLESRRR